MDEISDEQIMAAIANAATEDHTKEGWIRRQRLVWGRAILTLASEENRALRKALGEIAAIEDEMFGNDWGEIERARNIALAALRPYQGGETDA